MAVAGSKAVVVLDASTAKYNTKMMAAAKTTQLAVSKINRALTSLVIKAGVVGTALGLATAIVTKEAAKMQHGLTEIGTLMGGLTENEMAQMEKQLQDLAVATGESIEKLIDARYDVVSAAFTGIAESAAIMEAATKSAVATASEVDETADVFTTALNAYGMAAEKAMHISDILNVTIDKGKVRMSELANVMGRAIPLAAELGVPITELSAGIATLTKNGQDAREAVTALRGIFVKMLKPTEATYKVLDEVGYSSLDALLQAENLSGALKALKDGAESLGYDLADVINRARGMQAAFPLAGGSAKEFNRILKAIGSSAGSTQDDFDDMIGTLMKMKDRAWQTIKAIMEDIGDKTLPHVTEAFKDLTRYIKLNRDEIVNKWSKKLVGAFKLVRENIKLITKALKVMIRYMIIAFVGSIANNIIQLGKGLMMLGSATKVALVGLKNIVGIFSNILMNINPLVAAVTALAAAIGYFTTKSVISAIKQAKWRNSIKESRKAAENITISLDEMNDELERQRELAQFQVENFGFINYLEKNLDM